MLSGPSKGNKMDSTNTFSKGEALRFGWERFKNNLGFFIGLMIIVALIYIAAGIIVNIIFPRPMHHMHTNMILVLIRKAISWIVYSIISIGIIKIAIENADGKRGKISDLYQHLHLLPRYLLGVIIYDLIVFVGLILLIIPGIIWAVKYQFLSFFIVDKELSPLDALKESEKLTSGIKFDLFIFDLLVGIINILGALPFGLGLIITVPITSIAMAFIYRKLLQKKTEQGSVPEIQTTGN